MNIDGKTVQAAAEKVGSLDVLINNARIALYDGAIVNNVSEDIFPDPMTQPSAAAWRAGVVKAMERQNAAFVTAPAAA